MSSVVQCFDWMPSYEDLPMEIILQVFAYLGHTDRQSAGATCKRWYEALSYPELNTNVYAYFSKVTLSDEMQPLSSFNATARPITSYVLEDVTFGSINQFIDKISALALDITFDNCELSEKQFWLIIRQLKRLQKLKLTHCSNFFMYGSSLASLPTDDAQVMSNVKSLSLRDNKYITDGILSRIMTPISNLEVFDISGCHIAYHNAIHRRFYPGGVTEHRSDAVLTFMCALEMLRPHVEHLQELDFSNTLIGSTSLTALAALDSEGSTRLKLKRLRLSKCTQLNPEIAQFLKTQPDLVLLDLSGTNSINDECIQHIVEDNTQLEWLNIAGCSKLTNAAAVSLAKLQRLQSLDISHCIGITDTGIMEGIAARHNPTMTELNLSYMNLSSEAVKAIAKNLPNLLILNLSNCVHAVTDEVVQCIIEHLPQLTEFSLEACVRITDAALTGIDIAKLGLNTAMEEGSQDAFNPQPGLIENVAMSAHFPNTLKISLRSKAEEDIVRDAIRKKAMMKAYELSLVDEHDIDGFSIGSLQGLRKLILKDCNKITDVSLKYGLKLKELQHLSLSKCQQISCLGISALVKQSPAIELLDLNDCYNIDDKAVQAISEHLKRLQSLHVSGCSQLTEHALDSIIVNCKNLRELSICRCRRLYTNIEDRLASLRLRTLNMDNVSYFDNLDMFRKKKHVGY